MSVRDQMNRIYRDLSPDEIPWNMDVPPALLVELIEGGGIGPCKAIDLGCGTGTYSVWLAARGFHVTGVDISDEALALARQRATEAGATCRFEAADLIAGADELGDDYGFAFEWEVLHHVLSADRGRYLDNVAALLAPGGKYLLVCFSVASPAFGGQGKLRRTPLGTELYFSSEDELQALFEPRFAILELDTLSVPGKRGPHVAIRSLLQKP
jgi:SAM-dependent methyltransferase